ncbi:hypothetical protein KAT92_05880 [Candidatus Babeliales bacterium]|nr:hypothetical protein [Candidatus Babeliales bacterium]
MPDHVGAVGVAVYNARGQLIRQLVDWPLERGRHELRWDGADARGQAVALGVYFCRASLGERTAVRKVAAVRWAREGE